MDYKEFKKFEEFSDKVFCIVGYIDSNDAIHHKVVTYEEYRKTWNCNHSKFFPMQSHKLWRLYVQKWDYENSILTKDRLTKEDFENLEIFINKRFPRPRWKKHGDDWDEAGRPRGEEQDKFDEQWEKDNPID
jgi:hypothetical protein